MDIAKELYIKACNDIYDDDTSPLPTIKQWMDDEGKLSYMWIIYKKDLKKQNEFFKYIVTKSSFYEYMDHMYYLRHPYDID